ncbi:MAG: SprB repeat-containing protein [Flavobacteriales bacterium]|nr:SprB repeat-containing protein [Flavobacteriales bacterium]
MNRYTINRILKFTMTAMLLWGGARANAQIPHNMPIAFPQSFGVSALSLTYTTTLQCQGGFAVDLTVTGGIPPYQFAWSNGQDIFSNQQDIVVSAGGQSISVAVYDPLGNYSVIDVDVGISASIVNADCSGPANGSIDVTVPLVFTSPEFHWFDPDQNLIATTEDIAGLAPGMYLLRIFEQPSGCSVYSYFTVRSLPLISGSAVVSSDGWMCAVGAIDIIPVGGTAPYSFMWSQGSDNRGPTGVGWRLLLHNDQ